MFLIITKSGAPLKLEEVVVLFHTEAQAREWLMPGDKIVRAKLGIVGKPAIG